MVMDHQGYIHVSDSLNYRVQKIDRNGKPLSQFGRAGRAPGHFSRPKGIAVDREGIVYVADAMMGIVQLFDPEGRPLMYFGGTGVGDGRLYLPAQVTIDYDSLEFFRAYVAPDFKVKYLILVTNQLPPNKISVFAFGLGKAPPTTQPGPDSQPASGSRPK